MAAQNGHLEVVKLLLQDNRVDPSADYNYGNLNDIDIDFSQLDKAIKEATKKGYYEIVRLLLQNPVINPAVQDNYRNLCLPSH